MPSLWSIGLSSTQAGQLLDCLIHFFGWRKLYLANRELESIFLSALRFLYFAVEKLQVCIQLWVIPFFPALDYDFSCDFPEGLYVIRAEVDYHFLWQVSSLQKSSEKVQKIAHPAKAFSTVTTYL